LTRFERADALVDGFAKLIEVEAVLRLVDNARLVPDCDVIWDRKSVGLIGSVSCGGPDMSVVHIEPAVDKRGVWGSVSTTQRLEHIQLTFERSLVLL